jgi:serine/threonine protein kinase
VAVKILRLPRPERANSQLERFRREGISASRVNHPNAVTILDSGVSPEGIPYLVMELLHGLSLGARLEQCGGMLPIADCLRIIKPVCEVLVQAHAANVIHRDIKPDNIFLHQGADGETVKVLDFGIATLHSTDEHALTRLTNPDMAMGTALYMAPERMQDDGEDGQCDVYSLAVTLYIMLCGQAPFSVQSEDPIGTMFCHYYESPIPILEQNPVVPEQLAALVMDGLQKDPKQRPTAREFLAQLSVISAT